MPSSIRPARWLFVAVAALFAQLGIAVRPYFEDSAGTVMALLMAVFLFAAWRHRVPTAEA